MLGDALHNNSLLSSILTTIITTKIIVTTVIIIAIIVRLEAEIQEVTADPQPKPQLPTPNCKPHTLNS